MKIKEALEDGTLSLEDDIDYADMTEEEYKQEIERLNNIINKVIADIEDVRDTNNYYDDYKVDNSILTYWIDILKGSEKE